MNYNSIISKTIKIKCAQNPPEVDFVEDKIKLNGIEPLRWAIVDVNENELTLCASGRPLS